MIAAIVVLLIIFWFAGYITVPGIIIPKIILFHFYGRPISLWQLLIFAIIIWSLGYLPSPLREIATIFLVLWLLSTLGFLFFGGLAQLLIIIIILGLIFSLVGFY